MIEEALPESLSDRPCALEIVLLRFLFLLFYQLGRLYPYVDLSHLAKHWKTYKPPVRASLTPRARRVQLMAIFSKYSQQLLRCSHPMRHNRHVFLLTEAEQVSTIVKWIRPPRLVSYDQAREMLEFAIDTCCVLTSGGGYLRRSSRRRGRRRSR